ncbi:MAG: J domain-containing protein [Aquidulcibacter sp.]
MTDLYSILGVAKDATRDAIRKAFRAKAKTAHPDTGGSAEEFRAIELAHRVLSDDRKRAEYDATGQVDDQPDAGDRPALDVIAAFVDRFVGDKNAIRRDMLGEFRKAVKDDLATIARNTADADDFIQRCRNTQNRLKGDTGAKLLISMIDNKIGHAETAKRMLADQKIVLERALEIVADASFDFEKNMFDPNIAFRHMQDEMLKPQQASSPNIRGRG